jgi:hypothetical protein
VDKFLSISKTTIHFKVHKHLVVDGKCKEFVDETTRLVAKEVDHTHDMKISMISLSANKTFLARHVLKIMVMAWWNFWMMNS